MALHSPERTGRSTLINTGIEANERKSVIDVLNRVLADEYVLLTKTRNYHWNVTGPQFRDLHALFQEQYEALAESVDDVAERARALGGRAAGSLGAFLDLARIDEDRGESPDSQDMVRNLLHDHEAVVRSLRDDLEEAARLGDMGTNDLLTGLMRDHEKAAWMLRALLGAST